MSDSQWYKISQSAKNFSAGQWTGVHFEFSMLVLRAGNPREAALLINDDHSETYDYYFSPLAAEIARELIARHAGTPCASPIGVIPVSLVAGGERWEERLRNSSK